MTCSRLLCSVLFADDTTIFYLHKDLKVVNETLNNDLINVQVWLQANYPATLRAVGFTPHVMHLTSVRRSICSREVIVQRQ